MTSKHAAAEENVWERKIGEGLRKSGFEKSSTHPFLEEIEVSPHIIARNAQTEHDECVASGIDAESCRERVVRRVARHFIENNELKRKMYGNWLMSNVAENVKMFDDINSIYAETTDDIDHLSPHDFEGEVTEMAKFVVDESIGEIGKYRDKFRIGKEKLLPELD